MVPERCRKGPGHGCAVEVGYTVLLAFLTTLLQVDVPVRPVPNDARRRPHSDADSKPGMGGVAHALDTTGVTSVLGDAVADLTTGATQWWL